MFEEILDKLKQILQNNSLIAHVQDFEDIVADSDPFVTIVPNGNTSAYETTQENVRVYAFKVMIFVSRTDREKGDADRVLRGLVDSIIDDFDEDYTLENIGVPTKQGYTFLQVFATPSAWGYALPEDEYRVATIDLTTLVSVNLNNI
jgi:hypothetical protein